VLRFVIVIVDNVRHEDDKWKRLSRTHLRILTNTQQLPDQIDMRLVSLVFDYLHVFMHIMENDNQSK
ncbi:unnamed protein product, partial [Rotaria sp. Silwood1]